MLKNPTLKNVTSPDFGKPPEKQNTLLQQLGEPHVASFDYFLSQGLDVAVQNLDALEFALPSGDRVKLCVDTAHVDNPAVPLGTIGAKHQRVMPSECRQRGVTYRGKLYMRVEWFLNGVPQVAFDKDMGEIPIMLKSSKCNLRNLSPSELVRNGEHEQEWGGYFIVKGLHRLIRMLLMTRRNYPITIKRSGWKGRGAQFSDMGVSIRCVQDDQTATTNVLHFVSDGTAKFMFSHRKNLYYAPLILIMKCLCDYCDHFIYQQLVKGFEDNLYYADCVKNMLRAVHQENLHTSQACKSFLGNMFRIKVPDCPEWSTDAEVADFLLRRCVLIHLKNNVDKFNLLVFMNQKLFTFAKSGCVLEGADAVMMQEVLLGGHLYLQVVRERMQTWLNLLKFLILKRTNNVNFTMTQTEMLNAARQAGSMDRFLEMFLATGSLSSNTGLGLMQDKGLTIIPENINQMRYMSHFKAVHRGAFFQEMRTTEARQLLPDAWGFICPVHTPDGAPCGLLNHLTMNCIVTDTADSKMIKNLPTVLARLGMIGLQDIAETGISFSDCYTVMIDGNVCGYIEETEADDIVNALRLLKIDGAEIPFSMEIVLVPRKKVPSQYPGLFLFTGPARMMRPLIHLASGKIEYLGTFEQVFMDVAVIKSEIYPNITTHLEISETTFMSNLAHLIPMPDCNQSPRNMYQCQMGKQTMGTPCHNWDLQTDTKLYRLQTPSTPLFRPVHHDNIGLDDFAMGTNAIVAVISYTGYDMEDAMIINKSAEERGFAHGSIYKCEFIELDSAESYFCRNPNQLALADILDSDGMPYIGRKLVYDDVMYCFYDTDTSQFITKKFKGKENCYVHSVRMCGDFTQSKSGRTACLVFRVPRNPNVGDKFASRAGQKGICSRLWATEDLPFTESGLVPDIIFNPHGFPSRMTIAMMIELMAGKSGALHGLVHDATPFRFSEENTAIDYFGKLLEAGGYNYYGTEPMYSGIDGTELEARIFFGVVHYQRLRHMVADKWQVRSTGPLDLLTRQPIKGRKRGGGVRFGEMERDSLISHGATCLLQDRLLHCSDKTTASICTACNSILSPVTILIRRSERQNLTESKEVCRICNTGEHVSVIQVPYIFKLLTTQLAACNLKTKIEFEKA